MIGEDCPDEDDFDEGVEEVGRGEQGGGHAEVAGPVQQCVRNEIVRVFGKLVLGEVMMSAPIVAG